LLQSVFGEKVKYTESKYGKLITSIDGIEAKGSNYWAFYVNGQMGTVGADTYQLKAGDQISFQYESWENQGDESKEQQNQENTNTQGEVISAVKLQKAVDLASRYVLKNEVGEWEAIALRQAGKKLPENYLTEVTKQIISKKGRFSKITDYERYTLGILAAGGNPMNVAGYNLVEAIYNGNVEKQGLNGVFYGLIALDSANFEIPKSAKWSREKLVNNLLAKQNQDGGWSWDGGAKSDIDTTAMVLTALAPYKSDVKVNSLIDVAVKYLSQQYLTGKIDNSSTAAQVVIGLTSIGIEANNKLFINNGTSIIAYLLTYHNADGGFDWQGGNESDVFSTSQAFQAIVAFQLSQNGKGLLYNLPLTHTTNKPVVDNNKGQNNTDKSKIIENQEGKPLPNTATNTYNFLTFGLILMLLSAIFFMIEKRRKA
ncbi:MAG TPA: DUF4430 domain-containing protein, partial [Pseudoneobacillus sp.]|nr:DUF4430 domain-containing protein [Pseudoneobacillus sp.]